MPTPATTPHVSPCHQARTAAHPYNPAPAHRARQAAALAICLTVLGAGCANATNRTTYTPTWTPPATASASATPTLSPEDAAARTTALAMEPPAPYTPEFTPEGAATAATYFLELVPYVGATGDLVAFEDMSGDNCEFCNGVGAEASEMHDAGGWTDPWEQEITPLDGWVDNADPNRYVIRAQVTSDGYTEHPTPSAPSQQVEYFDRELLIQLYWNGDDWSVEALQTNNDQDSE
ncbi:MULTISPECIES: DUF6318 family protein [unclassified Actinomyces]|uniref:DUF6318 family protein n=1 Tax=unclassified Actinomyces TaxID=2609248 RepID=UPI000D5A18DB|nr:MULTISPECIES: DUF6318 family protein [unclassified Actinomyces]RAX24289.1 hypothetical protein DRB07_00825 [Actinomyces sp. Z3]